MSSRIHQHNYIGSLAFLRSESGERDYCSKLQREAKQRRKISESSRSLVSWPKQLEKQVHDEILHVGKDLTEHDQANEKSGDSETVSAEPVEVFLRAGFAHEEHDGGAAIERGNG